MNTRITLALTALSTLFLFSNNLQAQQGMGVGNANPQEMLDVTGAIKIGTDINNSNAAPSGGAGTIRFRAGQFEGWDGTSWIPLGGGGGTSPFVQIGNLVQPDNTVVNLATDDFIFGSPSLDDNANTDNDGRFFFDKSKGAFRAGLVTGDQWNDIKRGNQSFAAGYDVTASGDYSISLGERSRSTGLAAISMGTQAYAYGDHSFAWGNDVEATGINAVVTGGGSVASGDYSYASGFNSTASGEYSVAMGQSAEASNFASIALGDGVIASGESALAIGNSSTASGLKSVAAGWNNLASGQQSFAVGHNTTASGRYAFTIGKDVTASGRSAMAIGENVTAPSAYELAVGRYNESYTPASTTDWNAADRIFTVGNGTSGGTRSNALTILKNGNMGIGTSTPSATLHVDGTMRYVDGNQAAGFVATSDANGNITWTDPAVLNDGDWTINGNNQYSAVSGNVGVGTTTPTSKLHVAGGGWFENNLTTEGDVRFENTNGTGSNNPLFRLDGFADKMYIVAEGGTNGPTNGTEIRFRTSGGGTAIDRMTIDNSGNVGVGTTAPAEKFHVNGSIQMEDGNEQAGYIPVSDANGKMTWTDPTTITTAADADGDATNELQTLSISGNDISLSNGGGTVSIPNDADWTINGNDQYSAVSGNVGIGTIAPTQKLHLRVSQNTGQAYPLLIQNTTAQNGGGTGSGIGFTNMGADGIRTAIYNERTADYAKGKLHFLMSNTNTTADVNLATDSRMTITSAGNVGIGQTTPVDKFHVEGSIRMVDGNQQVGYIPVSDANGKMTWTDPTTITTSADGDGDATNELQTLSQSGTDVTLSDGGGTVSVADNDNDASNEIQDLSISGNILSLSGDATTVDLSAFNNSGTDDQNLTGATLTGTSLQIDIEGGTSATVDLSPLADDGDWVTNGNDIHNGNSGRVGIGTSTPNYELHIHDDALNSSWLQFTHLGSGTSTNQGFLIGLDNNTDARLMMRNNGNMLFYTNNLERMRLTAFGNLGLGTANPSEKLHVQGSIRMVDGNQQAGYIPVSNANGKMTWTDPTTVATANDGDWTVSGNNQYSAVSGNVGVGTSTPSAKLEVSGSESATHGTAAAIRLANMAAGGDTWTIRAGATGNETPAGGFSIAHPAGYRMVINSAGNVGFGTTDPTSKFHVSSNTSGDANGFKLTQGSANSLMYHNAANDLIIRKAAQTDQLVLDNDGNIGIGTDAPANKLHVEGAIRMVDGNQQAGYIPVSDANGKMTWTDPTTVGVQTLSISGNDISLSNGGGTVSVKELADADNDTKIQVEESADEDRIRFDIGGTESMIIREYGNVGIGTSSPDAKLHVEDDGVFGINDFVAHISMNENIALWSGQYNNALRITAGMWPHDGTNHRFISFRRPVDGAEIGAVRQTSSSSVDFFTPSDQRLKTNIQSTTKGLADLMQLQVKDYVYKDDPEKPQTGFIAQEVYEVFPNAVSVGGDDAKTDPWMMNYGNLTPLLVKAVQEQQALIEQLISQNQDQQKRIEKLEAQR